MVIAGGFYTCVEHVFDKYYCYCLRCGARRKAILGGYVDWECPAKDNVIVPHQFQKDSE